MNDKVTDPRPVPLPSIWAVLLAVLIPVLYVLWVIVAIPTATSGEELTRTDELSFAILRAFTQATAPVAIVLGVIGVLIVRRDPHLYRWQWVGFTAIAIGAIEIVAYVGGWLGWWPVA